MENKNEQSIVGKAKKKKYLKITGGIVLFLLVLQVTFYFGADFFLRNYLKEKVTKASNNKYEIDFETFHILLFQRGITFEGFTINPVEDKFDEFSTTPYYKVAIPELSITKLNYLFRKKEIVIGNIDLTSPVIDSRMDKMDSLEVSNGPSPLSTLQNEIKKSFLSSRLNEIRIRNINIKDADVLLKNFIAQKEIKAENTSIYLKDIQLLQMRFPETPFNAEGFSFDLDNFEVLLSDSIHTVKATEINVSSIENYIKAKKVNIIPDFGGYSSTYFQIDLENLLLSDADINKVFYTSEVEIGELKLQKPIFNLYEGAEEKKDTESKAFDFYNLIEGILASINIKQFTIDEGKFTQRAISEFDKHKINAERIDFKMEDFYVGPDESKKQDQFFYADNASVELYKVDLALGDSIHWITGDFVKLSSFSDEITIDGFHLFPINVKDGDDETSLFNIEVPGLMIKNANLKKTYNERIVDVSEIEINNPDILLKDLKSRNKKREPFDLKKLSNDYLEAIYVEKLVIKDGSLIVDNNIRIRQDSLSFGKISIVLENFALDQATKESSAKGIFWADHLQLELEDYALKLADNLHVFKADKIFLDTKSRMIKINGFALQPLYKGFIDNVLDRYGVTTSVDIFVPQFEALGVDIPRAYFEGELLVEEIRIPSPAINIYRHRAKIKDDDTDKIEKRELLGLLNNYFSEVKVDAVVINKAKVNYENYADERTKRFSEDEVSLSVKNFHIYEGINTNAINSLFSEEVDLSLNNYVFSFGDGKYNIVADRISFNSSTEEIITSNVKITPSETFSDKTKIIAEIPSLSFTGVGLEAFLFENTLNLEKVKLTGSSVDLLINNDWEETASQTARRKKRTSERGLPKNIEIFMIDTIEANNAQFSVSFKDQGTQRELVNTGINLSVFNFFLDSAKISKGEIAGFFEGLSLGIDEFWLTLNDSIHQVTFSKVELDTRYEGILLNNFRVIPKNLFGKPGSPVFSGHIPTVLIKTNSLTELQTSKDLWIKELRLFRPDLEIFIDGEKLQKGSKTKKSSEKNFLESLRIDDFEMMEGNLAIFDKKAVREPFEFNSLNFGIQELEFDLSDMESIDKNIFLKKDFGISFPNYEILLADSLNKLKIGLVSLTKDEIKLTDVEFLPRYGRYQYNRIVNSQVDVASVHIPSIIIQKPDLIEFVDNRKVIAKSVRLTDLVADIFRDKRYEREPGIHRYMPQELMQKAGMDVSVDSLFIENAAINYFEFPEVGMIPGQLSFNKLNAALYPFNLVKEDAVYPNEKMFLLANAKLNGRADLNLQAHFFFDDPYPINVNAQLGEFDLDQLNSILEPNAFVRVTRGKINGADWSFIADEKEAIGRMVILYSDLKLELLDERTLEKGTGRKGILTFVLNTFAVRSNNPRRYLRKPISSSIYEPRNTERFVFNYWWKATFSGLKGSLGLGQDKVPKKKRKEAEKRKKQLEMSLKEEN
ncbi:hypothetical protein SAMN00777080_0928 [Aquiflexum balticum DSM 16537]|uniref:Uncharacterized protein n=1 Tax=Aquiflexum balticum DSM 16537 TaxID=758820 RepID=A0A1W2H0D0_9BACT|nr:hypothetical protein [Aquiflexum balticum]SMD42380.1 hypothetical protein SAMN00777080_0928 [Aquiflexum balticum DSM 16537]